MRSLLRGKTYTCGEQAVRNENVEVGISQSCSQKMPLQELLFKARQFYIMEGARFEWQKGCHSCLTLLLKFF